MNGNFGGDLFSLFDQAVPDSMKKQMEEAKKQEAQKAAVKTTGKNTTTTKVSKSNTKKNEEVYVPLPTTVACGFNARTLTIDDFQPEQIVYVVEKPKVESNVTPFTAAKASKQSKDNEEKIKDMTEETEDEEDENSEESVEGKEDALKEENLATGDEYLYDETIPKVTLETIRQRLELEFPAFSKERTKMEYTKATNTVIPVTFSGSLGNISKIEYVAVDNVSGNIVEFEAENFNAARCKVGPNYAIMDKRTFNEVFHAA